MSAIDNQDQIEARFDHYWRLLGSYSADLFVSCKIVPSEESFKAMLRAAYGMGWTESRCVLDGDYPSPPQPPEE